MDLEFVVPLIQDFRADNVGGQQVNRKLDAGVGEVDRFLDHGHQQRFRQAGDALQQQVSAREERDQRSFDHAILANDNS